MRLIFIQDGPEFSTNDLFLLSGANHLIKLHAVDFLQRLREEHRNNRRKLLDSPNSSDRHSSS